MGPEKIVGDGGYWIERGRKGERQDGSSNNNNNMDASRACRVIFNWTCGISAQSGTQTPGEDEIVNLNFRCMLKFSLLLS